MAVGISVLQAKTPAMHTSVNTEFTVASHGSEWPS